VPKVVMIAVGNCFYSRYHETQADMFACENAESRLELEEYATWFRKRKHGGEVDFPLLMTHPLNDDRAAMIEAYLDKWDAEHNNTVEKS
jgi:Zn-dependent protease with chaperone function